MGRINQLPSKIYNRIAAGEVVDRPYSVVKELVENSIDSGADEITIKIENGGISSIKVIDNGNGIYKDDLKLSILPHATSKISSIKDLDNIYTLGFRGEALASIASVSRLSIVSRPQDQDIAAELYCEGGQIIKLCDCAGEIGTEITVNNLFFNTPAREKFLKSIRGEESDITNIITKFILGNYGIKFKYFIDNKLILQSFGEGFESSFVSIYGIKIVEECNYISTEKNGIKIEGYIGKPSFTKSNRTYQTVFLNERYINNNTISSAISNAYSKYLMKRQYPFYVLKINVPIETVDVNVHPNKIDVRFSNNQVIYGTLYNAIIKTIEKQNDIPNITKSLINNSKNSNDYITHNDNICQGLKFDTLTFNDPLYENHNLSKESDKEINDIFSQNKEYIKSLELQKINKNSEIKEQEKIEINNELKLIGQALNTFLILEDGTDLYFIDQHAAHERVLFDKFINEIDENKIDIQPLLIPYILNTNEFENQFLFQKMELLNNLGIEIEEFGRNSFKISSIPVILAEINLSTFFTDLLNDLNNLKKITLDNLLTEKIAQKACKAAIKAGKKLSENEIKELLRLLKGNLGLKCPHGRPIAIKITRTEIDKWFKRII